MTDRPLETGWLADTPDDDNLLRAFLENQADVNEAVALATGGRVLREDGIVLDDADSAVPYFNQALLRRPLEGADDPLLDETAAFFAGSDRQWTLLSPWPTPDLTPRGMTLVGHPAFVVRAPGPVDHTVPDDVVVEVVADAERLAVAEQVAIEGYPMEEAAGLPAGTVFPPALLDGPVRARLGLLEGVPVAVGLGYVGHGVVNLCLGATLPASRRRGVWEALVWARAADGPDLPTVAFTSDFSRPGFRRMGFLVMQRFTMWMRSSA